jgi:acyl-CoA thioester hydrolase
MFSIKVFPRFGDIDVLGHVNNTVLPVWFELARTPIMKIFDPELALDRRTFPLIMAHTDFDFTDQIYLKHEVEIKTWILKIGTKSITVYHEAWQQERLCTKGNCVIVYYDFNTEKTAPLPEGKKKMLSEHLLNRPVS